jgi:hypothetical protein
MTEIGNERAPPSLTGPVALHGGDAGPRGSQYSPERPSNCRQHLPRWLHATPIRGPIARRA